LPIKASTKEKQFDRKRFRFEESWNSPKPWTPIENLFEDLGDQIARIFMGSCMKSTEVSHIFGLPYSMDKFTIKF
jgi:hypothetical protein